MLTSLLDNWSSLYSNFAMLRTAIGFMHVGGLVVSGGCAIAADRITLRARRHPIIDRTDQLRTLHGTHRVVIIGLIVVMASGLLLFGADVDMFLYSKVFWLKMTLMLLLLVNGRRIVAVEHRIERGDPNAWAPLAFAARASVVLWTLTTLAGVALPNIG